MATSAKAEPKAASAKAEAPGVRASLGAVKDGLGRLIGAHRDLLVAELKEAGKQVAIIAGLAGIALVLALMSGILLYVGSLLFLGEWLFGSIGWGVLDGFLLTMCFVVPIGLNLAGGRARDWVRALLASLVLGVILGIVFSTNLLHNAAVWLAQQLQPSIALDVNWLVWLVPAVVIGLVVALIGLIIGLRRGGAGIGIALFVVLFVLAFVLVGFFAATPLSTQVAAAFAVTTWLILWMVLSAVFAIRGGLNPKQRYDKLVPRESMAQFAATRAYLEQQWQRQRKKLVGR
jgi:hypothetical protein